MEKRRDSVSRRAEKNGSWPEELSAAVQPSPGDKSTTRACGMRSQMTRRVKPELRSRYLPTVVGQASCLSVAAEKLREIFAKLFAGHGRLEACSTNQRRS